MKSGILEINDDELLLHQKHGETIRWSFKSLRRFGQGMIQVPLKLLVFYSPSKFNVLC